MSLFPQDLTLFVLIGARLLPVAVLLPASLHIRGAGRWSWALSGLLALMIMPVHVRPPQLDSADLPQLLLAVGHEGLLGLALGFGFVVILAGLQLTGILLTQLIGLNWSDISDPGNVISGTHVIHRYYTLVALVVLTVSGGHRQLIDALLDSFAAIPPGGVAPQVDAVRLLGDLLNQSLQTGIRAAAPIAFCLLVSTLVITVLARSAPIWGRWAWGLSSIWWCCCLSPVFRWRRWPRTIRPAGVRV